MVWNCFSGWSYEVQSFLEFNFLCFFLENNIISRCLSTKLFITLASAAAVSDINLLTFLLWPASQFSFPFFVALVAGDESSFMGGASYIA